MAPDAWTQSDRIDAAIVTQRIISVDLASLDVRVLKKPVDIATLAQVLAEHSSVGA